MCESIDKLFKVLKEIGFEHFNEFQEIQHSSEHNTVFSISLKLITPEYVKIREETRKLNKEKLKNVLHPIT